MSRNAFPAIEQEYNETQALREHSAMERAPTPEEVARNTPRTDAVQCVTREWAWKLEKETQSLVTSLDAMTAYKEELLRENKELIKQLNATKKRLRDIFAASALQGIIACFSDHKGCDTRPARVALAYEYADLMLTERDK